MPERKNEPFSFLVVCYTAVFSVVTQWGGALRDDTKNGCVADYVFGASPASLLQSRAWSYSSLALFARQLKQKERLLVV